MVPGFSRLLFAAPRSPPCPRPLSLVKMCSDPNWKCNIFENWRPYLKELTFNQLAAKRCNSLRADIRSIFIQKLLSYASVSSSTMGQAEKERILSLPLEDKRKLYKAPDFVLASTIEPWLRYAPRLELAAPQVTAEDEAECRKCTISGDLNTGLAAKVAIFKGDITKLEVDAIVNAANSRLQAGGGVDGAIHRAAGPRLQEECYSLNGCQTGQAKITGGYHLPAKYVIHTVGPHDKSAPKLISCYESCLALLPDYKIKSIAFACISTGIYGFPNRLAAHVALAAARAHLEREARGGGGGGGVEQIIFCTFMPVDVEIYETLMHLYFPLH